MKVYDIVYSGVPSMSHRQMLLETLPYAIQKRMNEGN